MHRILFSLILLFFAAHSVAQPPARLREATKGAENAGQNAQNTQDVPNSAEEDNISSTNPQRKAAAQRGSIREFPTAAPMPENAAWRRDVYRMLKLSEDANAPLYYPITPASGRVNLFVYLFHLILKGKIHAYEYTPDAIEHFDEKHIVKGKKIMDDNHIFYEANEGRLRVNDADIPSEDVKRYYLKESVYFDQQTGTFRSKVLALCPIVVSDFGDGQLQSTPLFWVNYEEAAPHLAKLSLMASNFNNASEISADDYFNTTRYHGDIYQTKNLQDKTIAQMAVSDSAQNKIRERIEQEIKDFQERIWGSKEQSLVKDADNEVTQPSDSAMTNEKEETPSKSRRNSRRSSVKTTTPKAPKTPKPKTTNNQSGTLSVRRQRH